MDLIWFIPLSSLILFVNWFPSAAYGLTGFVATRFAAHIAENGCIGFSNAAAACDKFF